MDRNLMIFFVLVSLLFTLYLVVILFKCIASFFRKSKRRVKLGKTKKISWDYITDRIKDTDIKVNVNALSNNKISDDIIAAISGAIYFSCFSRPGYKLVVRDIKRIPQTSPIWNQAGKIELLNQK